MKIPRRIPLYTALACVILLLGVFVLGYTMESTNFDHRLTLQAPLKKAFKNIASHELKPKIYKNISAELTKIEDFQEGSISNLCYMNKEMTCFSEEVLKVDSFKELSLKTIASRFTTTTNIYFESSYRRTQLHIVEEIRGKTAFDRAMLFFLKKPYLQQRKKFYSVIKSAVESTPDYDINPEDLK